MKKRLIAPLMALALSGMTGSAVASTIGLAGGTIVTTWDTFPNTPPTPVVFSNDAPDTNTGQVSATLSATMTGGNITGAGQRLYAGSFGPDSFPFDLAINGTTNETIPIIGLVLKFTPPSGGVAASANFFTVLLNGVAASQQVFTGASVEGMNNFQIYHWYWTDANLASGAEIQFTIDSAADHVTLDAIQIVPEPGSAVLGALGAAMLVIRRRRK
ncbi:PEP-CTERM sorting domain-containing protein [Luteolibacter arcticus]|uniref:PEP-CTERM sorting domain-containing protein n=1 Tax=Luteolibacter arcticus TaxID=1581411 RepID=A0ABT3GIX8_9BACT|nr:PEP-CTERM sorting domain-containing protein [Luteolibacter arcticus]MCW1923483.1 PEP-CTERM sorting domain-containing protein [Luteolibacter arcticus]